MLRRESEEDQLNAAHCIRKLLETNMYMEQITNDTATIKRLLYLLETTQHFPIKVCNFFVFFVSKTKKTKKTREVRISH